MFLVRWKVSYKNRSYCPCFHQPYKSFFPADPIICSLNQIRVLTHKKLPSFDTIRLPCEANLLPRIGARLYCDPSRRHCPWDAWLDLQGRHPHAMPPPRTSSTVRVGIHDGCQLHPCWRQVGFLVLDDAEQL